MILVCKILRKFDSNNLYICPPYLYTVTTLPWEIPKKSFFTVVFIQTSDYYVISEETICKCCTAGYLFIYCCLLLPIIFVALFCGHFYFLSLWLVTFKATNANPQPALFRFRVADIWRNAILSAVRFKSFTFYTVVWLHFSRVVGKGVTVCFF